jgi:hypothetical protein
VFEPALAGNPKPFINQLKIVPENLVPEIIPSLTFADLLTLWEN